jgi:hypothetical protein
MMIPFLSTCAVAILSAIGAGGCLYESLVIDSAWPKNPTLIQPKHGGVRRVRFWIPAHVSLEIILITSIAFNWAFHEVRFWLLLALACHGVMRIWSFADLIPRALAFEDMDASSITDHAAKAWTSRSLIRFPFSLATVGLAFAAVVVSSRHGPTFPL